MQSLCASGLFHQAILHSGSELNSFAVNEPGQEPWTYLEQVADAVGCTDHDQEVMVECLRQAPAQDVANVTVKITVSYKRKKRK